MIAIFFNKSYAASRSTPQKLYKDLFENYYKGLRPVYNQTQPITLSIHLWFKQILKVDEIDQILTVYCWLELVKTFKFVSKRFI